jgi:hypothetical protein
VEAILVELAVTEAVEMVEANLQLLTPPLVLQTQVAVAVVEEQTHKMVVMAV